ncbi:MAG: FAD-dependent oxidoreductase [Planctomycetaceae bacterium]|nr:FAD-dependent oxidoreductase [Planctomycetaceae bacterium]
MSERCIILLGIGHTNAHVVREWARKPIPNCRLVCVSTFPKATYSGMLPGTLAGQFRPDEMEIDLPRLTAKAGATLVHSEVTGIDWKRQMLHLADADSIKFDVMSVGVGSVPSQIDSVRAEQVVAVKPMQTFLKRLAVHFDKTMPRAGSQMQISIIGGGVAGLEIAMCLLSGLRFELPLIKIRLRILTADDDVATELPAHARAKLRRIIANRGVEVIRNARVAEVTECGVMVADGRHYDSDCVIWATGAKAPPVVDRLELPVDDRGFLLTNSTLQSVTGLPVFAVGDTGSIVGATVPKAGVYAVRQSPVLWHNLQAVLSDEPLMEFRPQRSFLKLLNTGDGKALLQYKSLSIHARWCWTLKTWIDRRFLRQFQV